MSEIKPNTQIKTLLKDYQPPAFKIETVHLTFDLAPTDTKVTADMRIVRQAPGPLVLNGDGLTLESIALDGKILEAKDYKVDQEKKTLTIDKVPDKFELQIKNKINPQKNTALNGLYCSNKMFCTQCEPEGFRHITYFIDRPDVMAVYTTTIIADKAAYPVLLSNGNCVEQGEVKENSAKHFATWHDPFPKPSYLFALVAGPLVAVEDTYVTKSKRLVDLKIYVEPENQDSCAHAMGSLKRAMRWDEETYGREYDLDIYMIVAVNDFNMGAMENKGLNIFNAKYILARPEFATDTDFGLIDAVVGHEYFHNWSGNRITCRDWFQLCLKEGLTVFREQDFSESLFDSPSHRIDQVEVIRSRQFQEDASPMAHPVRPEAYVEINNFYTVTVYEKGAEVIRMLRTLLGPKAFRAAMDQYFADNDGKAATVEDFVKAMQAQTKLDLTQFMRWYTQAGTPRVAVTEAFDAASKKYTLTLEQKAPVIKTAWQPCMIPVAVELFNKEGKSAKKDVLILNEPKQTYVFSDIAEQPLLSIFQEFSAPVKVERAMNDEMLQRLCQHDTSPVNRWDACQQLVKQVLKDWVQFVIPRLDRGIQDKNPLSPLLKTILLDETLNKDLKVALLQPPSLPEVMDMFTPIPIEAVEKAYRHWIKTLSQDLAIEWQQTFMRWQEALKGPYVYTPEAVAQRGVQNLALWYWVQGESEAALSACANLYHNSTHMTNTMAALRATMHIGDKGDFRSGILADYEKRWKHHPLAMNKWFGVQAGSWRTDTLDKVQALSQHANFSWRNPNNVYALLNTFVHNPFRFHQADGQGYAFVEQAILRLDPENPQVAARLMQGWMDWKKYDPGRQKKLKAALERILKQPKLSKDVSELANKYN